MKTVAAFCILALIVCVGCRYANCTWVTMEDCRECNPRAEGAGGEVQQGKAVTTPVDLARGASAAVGPAAQSGQGGAGIITVPDASNPFNVPKGASTLEFRSPEMIVTPN